MNQKNKEAFYFCTKICARDHFSGSAGGGGGGAFLGTFFSACGEKFPVQKSVSNKEKQTVNKGKQGVKRNKERVKQDKEQIVKQNNKTTKKTTKQQSKTSGKDRDAADGLLGGRRLSE